MTEYSELQLILLKNGSLSTWIEEGEKKKQNS